MFLGSLFVPCISRIRTLVGMAISLISSILMFIVCRLLVSKFLGKSSFDSSIASAEKAVTELGSVKGCDFAFVVRSVKFSAASINFTSSSLKSRFFLLSHKLLDQKGEILSSFISL